MFTPEGFQEGDNFLKALDKEPATFKADLAAKGAKKGAYDPPKSLDQLCKQLESIPDTVKLTPRMRENLRQLVAHVDKPQEKENVPGHLLNIAKGSESTIKQKAQLKMLLDRFEVPHLQAVAKSKTVEELYGKGIENPFLEFKNACYLNSVVQALRLMPAFRNFFDVQVLFEESELIGQLSSIFDRLKTHSVDLNTIQNFRELAGSHGWVMDSITSQEDAALFCGFLLDQIKTPPFSYKMLIKPRTALDFKGLEAPGLLRQGGTKETMLSLGLGTGEATSVAALVTSNVVEEEVLKADLRHAGGKMPSAKELESISEKTPVISDQTVCFASRDAAPQMLPIHLKRYKVDELDHSRFEKLTNWVEPSMKLLVPIEAEPDKMAAYHLHAIIIHEGKSPQDGHYYTYMLPEMSEGEPPAMVKFNDTEVTLHKDLKEPYENAAKNGYIYFYQLSGIVDAKKT